jgi:hypothetical protein
MEFKNNFPIADKIISETNLLEEASKEKIRQKLIVLLDELIQKDFNALVQLLYRIDVDEKKIRSYLQENKTLDSAPVLADLIIERQLTKINSRREFHRKNDEEDEEEKW